MSAEEVSCEDKACRRKRDSAKGQATRERVTIRRLESKDSIQELTDLLHRAFKSDGQHSYTYGMAEQSEETTRMQIKSGDCWVAELDGRLIGVVILYPPRPDVRRRWYRPRLSRLSAYLRLVAVHPDFQGVGIGTMLLCHCERIAMKMGAWELAGSCPVGSRQLSLFKRRGYRVFRYVSFSGTDHHSVIFAKWMRDGQKESTIRRVLRKPIFCKTFLAHYQGMLR
jgi:GNAT superfamily N-acetyltransferase